MGSTLEPVGLMSWQKLINWGSFRSRDFNLHNQKFTAATIGCRFSVLGGAFKIQNIASLAKVSTIWNHQSPNLSFEALRKIQSSWLTAGSRGVEDIMIGTEDEIDRDLRWAMNRPMSQATS